MYDEGLEKIFQEALDLKKRRKYREALRLIERLLQEHYGGFFFFSTAAHLYFILKDYSKSLDMAENALHMNRGNQFTRSLRGKCLYHLGRKDEAGQIFSPLALEDPGPHTVTDITKFLRENGDTEGAVALLDRSLERLPGNRELLLEKADILEKAGRDKDAEACYQTILAAHPDDEYSYGRLIDRRVKNLAPPEVVEELQNILAIPSKKDNISVRKLLARTLYGSKRYREAYEQYGEILKIDSENNFARKQMSFSLVHLDDYEGAMPLLEESFMKEPDDMYIRNALLKAYVKTGREKEGSMFFRSVLARYPSMKNLWGVIRKLGAGDV